MQSSLARELAVSALLRASKEQQSQPPSEATLEAIRRLSQDAGVDLNPRVVNSIASISSRTAQEMEYYGECVKRGIMILSHSGTPDLNAATVEALAVLGHNTSHERDIAGVKVKFSLDLNMWQGERGEEFDFDERGIPKGF